MNIPGVRFWLACAAINAAIGGTVVALRAGDSPPPAPVIGATTTEKSRGSDTTGETTGLSAVAPPASGTVATTTLFGSPFTTASSRPPTLTLPPSTVPTTEAPQPTSYPSTVAPCPPCPQFDYAVLAATTVTNTGPTTVSGGVGLWPGTAVTGFPPGIAVVDAASPAANAAQVDLIGDYLDAMLRPSTTVNAQLGGLTLTPGVYSGPAHMALDLTGTLTLNGPGVYVFQTDSTLVTASGSRVALEGGARACDVFWQVGSSATLGTGSSFAGTIMALASITVTTGVTVQGRALAQTGAVTLDSDTFIALGC